MPHTFLSQLDWRFAVKKFAPEKKVSDTELATIIEAIRKAPTSAGLQPFHVYVVTDPALRSEIKGFSSGQSQVTDASHLLVFCVRSDIDERINAYIDIANHGHEIDQEQRDLMEERMKRMMGARTKADLTDWAARQMYIALGFGLAACAELGIDSCPMEGFNTHEIDRILKVPEYLHAVAYMTIGYRSDDPARPKVRFSAEELFTKK